MQNPYLKVNSYNKTVKASGSQFFNESAQKHTPGPGSYNYTNGFDQIKTAMQNAKTLQNFGLDQFGIQLVKPNTSFASKVRRFEGNFVSGKADAPGPGQYNFGQDWQKTRGQTRWKSDMRDS